jgi:hypothetical protein
MFSLKIMFMARWFWRFLSVVGALARLGYLLSRSGAHFGPRKPALGVLRKQIANEILPVVVENLRQTKKTSIPSSRFIWPMNLRIMSPIAFVAIHL